jgi:hypothetical protein
MPFSGELTHAAFLHWMRQAAPSVATWLHDGNKRRLFTCSSLQFPLSPQRMHEAERGNVHLPLHPDRIYSLRVTLLLGDLFPLLYDALLRSGSGSHEEKHAPFMQLGKQEFLLQGAVMTGDSSGWTGFTSCHQLVEEVRRCRFGKAFPLTLEFASLTTFNRSNLQNKQYGSHYALLPLPQYLFPMLANRWVELAPPELAHLVQRECIEQYIAGDGIIIDDYDLRPHVVTFPKHPQRGFTGTCTYELRGPDEEAARAASETEMPLTVRQQILLLSKLAFYTGVGAKTAMGMGRVRLKMS